jgi:hypothetical protein
VNTWIGTARPPITAVSTATMLCGLLLTCFTLNSNHAVGVFAPATIGIGLSLSLASGIEATAGIRSLIRVDILAVWALYGLTFLEFLFPQPDVDALMSPYAVLLGFAGLAVGRLLVSSAALEPRRGVPKNLLAAVTCNRSSVLRRDLRLDPRQN